MAYENLWSYNYDQQNNEVTVKDTGKKIPLLQDEWKGGENIGSKEKQLYVMDVSSKMRRMMMHPNESHFITFANKFEYDNGVRKIEFPAGTKLPIKEGPGFTYIINGVEVKGEGLYKNPMFELERFTGFDEVKNGSKDVIKFGKAVPGTQIQEGSSWKIRPGNDGLYYIGGATRWVTADWLAQYNPSFKSTAEIGKEALAQEERRLSPEKRNKLSNAKTIKFDTDVSPGITANKEYRVVARWTSDIMIKENTSSPAAKSIYVSASKLEANNFNVA